MKFINLFYTLYIWSDASWVEGFHDYNPSVGWGNTIIRKHEDDSLFWIEYLVEKVIFLQ